MEYVLRDAVKPEPVPYRSLEDKAVLILRNTAGKVWPGIAPLACAVVSG